MPEHLVLYRKYRPRAFDEIVGQESVVKALSNTLASGKLAHAYLFSGPRGVGKTTIARLIAKAANCQEFGGRGAIPCNKCVSCKRYNDGATLDVIEIDAASNRGIDEIRELRENVRFSASEGGKKTYIIDEVHMLTAPAFNALLKTLEEPPEHVVFVLATTEIDKVPATIISRTQHYEFRRPSVGSITKRLLKIASSEKVSLDESAARVIALAAEGSLRDAESILGQVIAIEDKKITEAEVEETLGIPSRQAVLGLYVALAKKNTSEALAISDRTTEEGRDPAVFLKALVRLSRSALFLKLDPMLARVAEEELLPEEIASLKASLSGVDQEYLKKILLALAEAESRFRVSPIPELPLELAILDLTRAV